MEKRVSFIFYRSFYEAITLLEQPNICQISVLQNGNEVYGAEWNGYQRTDCAHIMSATKSVMSLLVGIAVDRGWIGSVEDKVLSYFPEYPVKRGEKTIRDVTIKHLLTMRAPYKGHGDPWTKVCSSADWTAASLDFLGGRKGITGEFDYRTVCLHILSGLLYKAAGMKTVDFANQYLFRPLGIREHENYYAETAEEHKRFTIDKLPRKNVWFSDPQGLGTPGGLPVRVHIDHVAAVPDGGINIFLRMHDPPEIAIGHPPEAAAGHRPREEHFLDPF